MYVPNSCQITTENGFYVVHYRNRYNVEVTYYLEKGYEWWKSNPEQDVEWD